MKLNMRINYTLSQGLDVFPFVTADKHHSTTFAILDREETIRENGGRVNQIGGKVKDTVLGGWSKTARLRGSLHN